MVRERNPGEPLPEDPASVGYCRPPQEHRFKKGHTSNPWGRRGKPKPKVDFLDEEVVVSVAGKPRRMKRWEILDRALFQHGTSGNVSAAKLLLENHRRRQQDNRHDDKAEADLSVEDRAAFERLIERSARGRQPSTSAQTGSNPSDADPLDEDAA